MKQIKQTQTAAIAALFLFGFFSIAMAQESRWRAEGWKTDFSRKNIDFAEVLSGGPPKDGIPPIDNPKFITVAEETELTDRDPIVGLTINGDSRAYPLRVLTWHEIVNDTVGGKPVAITYCPLCNAAIVFDAQVDGKTLTFGTTGKLRNSDLIMYDRSSESWWQQFIGTGIAGKYTDKKLKLIPARLESWKEFRDRHPNGQVLVPNNPNLRDYGRNPYADYDISSTPFLYNGAMPEGISPMARVVVIRHGENPPIIVRMADVREKSKITLNGFDITWKKGQASALHASQISKGREVGTIAVTKQQGGQIVPYDVTFAFVAHAFHPEVPIQKF